MLDSVIIRESFRFLQVWGRSVRRYPSMGARIRRGISCRPSSATLRCVPARRPGRTAVPVLRSFHISGSYVGLGGGPLRTLLGVSGGSCDVCTGMYTSFHPLLTSKSESLPNRGFALVAPFSARFKAKLTCFAADDTGEGPVAVHPYGVFAPAYGGPVTHYASWYPNGDPVWYDNCRVSRWSGRPG